MMRSTYKKVIKPALILIAILGFLIGGAITFLVTTIDQDLIKNKAIQLVHDKTRRELKIAGNINWTFFPWLGVKIQNVSLSNNPEFNHSYFAKAQEIGINIKLLPLILGHIEIGNLILTNLDLQLAKNSFGNSNWLDLLKFNTTGVSSNTDKNSRFSLSKLTIGNVIINNGNVFWQDQKLNKKIKFNKFNLHCKNISFKQPFDLKISFNLDDSSFPLAGEIIVKTRVILDLDQELYEFKYLNFTGRLKNQSSKKFFELAGNTNIKWDVKKQILTADNLKLDIAKTNITGSLQGTNIINNPNFYGNLIVNNPNSSELIQLLGGDKYLKKAPTSSFKTKLAILPGVIKFQAIEARLNDMLLQGQVEYTTNKITFNLALNKLDCGLFIGEAAPTATKTKSHIAATTPPTTTSSPSLWQTTKIAGDLRIGNIQFNKLRVSNLLTRITSNQHLIECQNMGFDFYQGEGYGHATIDTRTSNLNLKLHLANVPIQTLLRDLAGYERFSGALSLSTNININSLSGDGKLWINRGSYSGIDIPYEVRRVHAVINAKPLPKKSQPPHTDFKHLALTFKINNGLLNSNDLLIQSPDYKVTGQGNANLPAKQLDLSLSAYSTHDENFFIPIKITGAFTNPTIRINTAVMLQHVVKKVIKDTVQNQLEKHLQNLPQNLNKILPLDKLFQ